jgi:phytoene dehydrogenase-like protein
MMIERELVNDTHIHRFSDSFAHVSKQLAGLDRFYLAGQWVEPGGGVPMAIMSGRHVIEIVRSHLRRPFVIEPSACVPVINQ